MLTLASVADRPALSLQPADDRSAIAGAYGQAVGCQDACNLSGVVASFARMMDALWIEARYFGQGSDHVNRHPIVNVVLCKLAALNREYGGFERFGDAMGAVEAIAALGADGIGSERHRAILDAFRDGADD